MLNKSKNSYKAEEQDALKLLTRALIKEEIQSLSTLSSIVTTKLGVLSL